MSNNDDQCKSIYDLAKLSGVSYGTVSRVLNGRSNVSEAAKTKVLEAAAKYNFKPRMQARKTTVGLLFNLERNVTKNRSGYNDTMLLSMLNFLSIRKVNIEMFTHYNRDIINGALIDGLISLDDNMDDIAPHITNIPVVVINGKEDKRFSRVYSDHYQSGALSAQYLTECGCKKPAILLDSQNWGNTERLNGFMDTFKTTGATPIFGYIAGSSEITILHNMFSQHIDGLFLAGEDNILEHLNNISSLCAHRPAPKIITMENPVVSRFLMPPLTTLAQPFELIVQTSIELLLAQIEKKHVSVENKVFLNTLIRR